MFVDVFIFPHQEHKLKKERMHFAFPITNTCLLPPGGTVSPIILDIVSLRFVRDILAQGPCYNNEWYEWYRRESCVSMLATCGCMGGAPLKRRPGERQMIHVCWENRTSSFRPPQQIANHHKLWYRTVEENVEKNKARIQTQKHVLGNRKILLV